MNDRSTRLDYARAVADAVLYEGYLLYPYRASSGKNRSRWQFGVLGPAGAAAAGVGEDSRLSTQVLIRPTGERVEVAVRLRFLHLQRRAAERVDDAGSYTAADDVGTGAERWLSWDEAVAEELDLGRWWTDELAAAAVVPIDVPGGQDVETVSDGRLVRTRRPLRAVLRVSADAAGSGLVRLGVSVENITADGSTDAAAAIAASLIGTNLLLTVDRGDFVSMTDPGDHGAAAARCEQHRCWPVLAGPDGDLSMMLVSPIILYDHPQIAAQSVGDLFDATEIDEILTLRVMTMTDEEKANARATDAKAAAIIDRCEAMSPEAMQQLHGILRDPAAGIDRVDWPGPGGELAGTFGFDGEVPWWDPAVDASVSPQTDSVTIAGVEVAAGSLVRIRPNRRADAQDMFYADQIARVSAVHTDVDGETHVAVTLRDDPASDLHDWYGRYRYYAPDELVPVPAEEPDTAVVNREENRS